MHKRFRKLENEAIRKHYKSTSSNATTVNINTSKSLAGEKCVRQKETQPIEVIISDSSSDEFDKKNQMEEENLKRHCSDPRPLKLVQHNSYQPLSVSSTAKSPSQPRTSNIFGISNCSTASSAACCAAYNNFRQTLTAVSRNQNGINKTSLDFASIADDANTNLQRNKTFVSQKYMRQRQRNPIEVHISDTSSDELHKEGKLDEENHKRLPNLKRCSSDAKPLRLMHHNRYRPLPISITTKYQSQTKPINIFDEANCSTESSLLSSAPNQEIMNKTLLDSTPISSLEANMDRMVDKQQMDSTPITSLEANMEMMVYKQQMSPKPPKQMDSTPITSIEASMERMVDKQKMDSTPITSLEANMERMVYKQQMSPKLVQKKQRCVKGGYVYEFNKVMLKERMDKKNQMEEENLKRYGNDPSPLKLVQHNSYQPLSVSSPAKSPSQPRTSNMFDISNCSTASSAVSPAACRAVFNNFQQTLTAISRNQKGINKTSLDFTSIADDANTNLQRNKTFVSQKYMRQRRRNPIEVHISDTSSDELHKEGKLDEENHKRLPNLKRYSSDAKPLRLMHHNRYRPLPISITTKYQSQTKPINIFDEANCSTESSLLSSAPNQEIMNKTLLDSTPISSLEANMDRMVDKQQMDSTPITSLEANMEMMVYKQQMSPKPPKQMDSTPITSIEASMERMVDKQKMDSTPITSLEANMERMVYKQQMSPKLVQKKQRCAKGGYVYEFNKVMLKERMDRRSLAQNKRLGISSRCRVQVLNIIESFGVKMAQVKPLEEDQDKGKFNIIISPMTVGGNISVGATVELYFDLKPETALKLPNNELVYVHPNKLVLL